MKTHIKKPKNFFNRMKIKKQLYSIYVIAILLPVLVIGGYLLGNTSKLLLNYHHDLIESNNMRIRTILFEITSQIYIISEAIAFDNGLQEIMTYQYESQSQFLEKSSNYRTVENYVFNYAEIDDISIYTDNPNVVESKRFHPVTDEVRAYDWYQTASNQSSVVWYPMEYIDKYGNHYWNLSLVRKIPLTGSPYHAIMVIKISDNNLKSRIETNDYYTELSLNQEGVFYSGIRDKYGQRADIPIDYKDAHYQYTGPYQQGEVKYLLSTTTLSVYQSTAKIYICTLNKEAYKNLNSILFTCGLILLLAVSIPAILIHYFTKYFTGRVDVLREEMHKASKENYNIINNFYGEDELSEAFADLEVMVQKIKEKDKRMYEARITEQKFQNEQQVMEFKMLASQINPHFLYNTLETIRMKALTAGNREVANSIKLLGKSMRYVLENTGTASTSLKNELDYIEIYLQIQRMRFADRVNYQLEIEEGLETGEYEILPLLLQPIVENAIIHGLEQVEQNGMITIQVDTRGSGCILIHIQDNGQGMSEEELAALKKKIDTPNSKLRSSIGLYNINQRIRLCYGESYGMDIKSKLGEGTTVSLTLPLKNLEEEA